jgi:hypothetical protein
MKALLCTAIAGLVLIGCAPSGDAANNAPTTPDGPPHTTSEAAGGSGVAPMASGAAGGMTPMSGTDSVQGSGGGSVGAAAKGMAKEKAGLAGGSSLDQMPTGE